VFSRLRRLLGSFVAACAISAALGGHPAAAQTSAPALEIARYRLTEPVFTQFRRASQSLVVAVKERGRTEIPLFTREIAVTGDLLTAAEALEARLNGDAAFTHALSTAGLTPRQYTRFALALIAARLAHGFMQAGMLKSVPAGAPTDNVAFVASRVDDVDRVLAALGVERSPSSAPGR
jgi:hypothetical protein